MQSYRLTTWLSDMDKIIPVNKTMWRRVLPYRHALRRPQGLTHIHDRALELNLVVDQLFVRCVSLENLQHRVVPNPRLIAINFFVFILYRQSINFRRLSTCNYDESQRFDFFAQKKGAITLPILRLVPAIESRLTLVVLAPT